MTAGDEEQLKETLRPEEPVGLSTASRPEGEVENLVLLLYSCSPVDSEAQPAKKTTPKLIKVHKANCIFVPAVYI